MKAQKDTNTDVTCIQDSADIQRITIAVKKQTYHISLEE